MSIELKSDWQTILTRAWSMRLIILSAVLSGLEVAMPFVREIVDIQPGTFAVLSFVSTASAGIARVIAQPKAGL